jgi:general stress protein YciG
VSGTKEGGKKLRQTMIIKHGSEAAWKAYIRQLAINGGKKSRGGGFTGNPELAHRMGKLGGRPRKDGTRRTQDA